MKPLKIFITIIVILTVAFIFYKVLTKSDKTDIPIHVPVAVSTPRPIPDTSPWKE